MTNYILYHKISNIREVTSLFIETIFSKMAPQLHIPEFYCYGERKDQSRSAAAVAAAHFVHVGLSVGRRKLSLYACFA